MLSEIYYLTSALQTQLNQNIDIEHPGLYVNKSYKQTEVQTHINKYWELNLLFGVKMKRFNTVWICDKTKESVCPGNNWNHILRDIEGLS